MEHATLRPVPLRPAGPVDPADALAHVLASLPELDDEAARALSLVEIAGRTRDQAGDEAALSFELLADALYRARKALRRSIFPLSASGWCERAERLLSDRIDGMLVPPGPARLDVHLRNCERCVDHERRLSHAREKLVREFIDAHPESADAGPAERAGTAALRVVEPVQVAAEPEPAFDGPTRTVPGFGGPSLERGEPDLPLPSFAGPGGQSEIVVEPRAETPSEPGTPSEPEDPTIEQDIAPAEPADATPSEHDAEDPEPPVEENEKALATSLVWGTLTFASVGLATLALVVTVLAIAGMDRIF
ncbi:MAG: zf-HC2 domain-containing protein [Thermoleophilaceae bacterium]